MKTLKEIKQMPTLHENVHESIYKSHSTLQLVKDMLKRGDSRKTILMIVEDLYTPSEAEIRETVESLKKMVDNPHVPDDVKDRMENTLNEKFPNLSTPFKSSCSTNKPMGTEV